MPSSPAAAPSSRRRGPSRFLRARLLSSLLLLLAFASPAPIDASRPGRRRPRDRWHHASIERGGLERSARAFLHDRDATPLRLPLEVNVALVGFDGDGGFGYELEPDRLAEILRDTFASFRPSRVEDGERLEVSVELKYNVVRAPPGGLRAFEAAVRANARRVEDEDPPPEWTAPGAARAHGAGARRWRAYDVEATGAVEAAVEEMYEAMFADGGESGKRSNAEGGSNAEGSGSKAGPVAVFILNPSKRRVDPEGSPDSEAPEGSPDFFDALSLEAEEGGFAYRYAYANSAGRSAAWLGRGRFAVVDLSAGPCAASRVGASPRGELRTAAWAAPRLAPAFLPFADFVAAEEKKLFGGKKERARVREGGSREGSSEASSENRRARSLRADASKRRDARFVGALSEVVASATRHVFAPDLHAAIVDRSARVLMPIIVLRDHATFAPLDLASAGADRHVDAALIAAEARRMLPPGQTLVAPAGTHNLHEHEHLAAAALRARRVETVVEGGGGGGVFGRARARSGAVIRREYLDSATLLDAFRRSADLLASGIRGLDDERPGSVPEDSSFLERSVADSLGAQRRAVVNPYVVYGSDDLSFEPVRKDDGAAESGTRRSLDDPFARRKKTARPNARTSARSGTRIVPVYVLSLAGIPPGTLIDGESTYAAAADLVVVLQPVPNASLAAPGHERPGAWARGRDAEAVAEAAGLAEAADEELRGEDSEEDSDSSDASEAGLKRGTTRRRASVGLAAAARRAALDVARRGGGSDDWTPLRFVENGRVVRLNPSATRAAVAGVAVALAGLADPTRRRDAGRGGVTATTEDWLWATGAHPFGPFGAGARLSEALADVARRNHVLARLDAALRRARKALEDVERFGEEFLEDPFEGGEALPADPRRGDAVDSFHSPGKDSSDLFVPPGERNRNRSRNRFGSPRAPRKTWLDYLFSDPERVEAPGRLPQATVAAMARDLARLESVFVRLGETMYERDENGASDQADAALETSEAFGAFVERELANARETLACCRTAWRRRGSRAGGGEGGLSATIRALEFGEFGAIEYLIGAGSALAALALALGTATPRRRVQRTKGGVSGGRLWGASGAFSFTARFFEAVRDRVAGGDALRGTALGRMRSAARKAGAAKKD